MADTGQLKPSVGFVGAGAVARALAGALSRAGYPVVAVSSRTAASAQDLARQLAGASAAVTPQQMAEAAQVVFITTPDDAIEGVAQGIAWRPGQIVAHCSGALTSDPLRAAHGQGAHVGVFHPFYSFPTGAPPPNFSGVFFGIEGDLEAMATLQMLAFDLGGQPVAVPGDTKVYYHLAAVFASNYLVGLAAAAQQMWERANLDPKVALSAVLPLMRETLDNLERTGAAQALTGPVVRGDLGTVERHLAALKDTPMLAKAYAALADIAGELAQRRGVLDAATLAALRASLRADGQKT